MENSRRGNQREHEERYKERKMDGVRRRMAGRGHKEREQGICG
jgi:hypothetical protein